MGKLSDCTAIAGFCKTEMQLLLLIIFPQTPHFFFSINIKTYFEVRNLGDSSRIIYPSFSLTPGEER